MRRRSTQIVSILLVLVLVLAAAGCGKKKSDTSTTTTTTTEAAATTTTSADETTTTSSTTTAATGLGHRGELQAARRPRPGVLGCLQRRERRREEGGGGPQGLRDKTPEDIRPDFETLADAFGEISGALKGVDLSGGQTPDAATLAKLLKLSQKFQDPKFTTAMDNIETWATKNCHA